MKADAVFEGGGVKGIAFIGALHEMEKAGYEWERIAGTSAGAIIASLLAAGYRSEELQEIFFRMHYPDLLRGKGWRRIPLFGPFFNVLWHKGLYGADHVEEFVADLLRRKGIERFRDLPPGKLRIIASDITEGRMLILPDDLRQYAIDPLAFPVARAVRMSASIPYFFQPCMLARSGVPHYIVDGGLLSNFPVWLFDAPGTPRWPTFGFRLHEQIIDEAPVHITGLFSFSKALISTMLEAHDRLYVSKAHAVRTVFIPSLGIKTTQFDLSDEQKRLLYESGRSAAREFLSRWNFQTYIAEFRQRVNKQKAT